MMFSFIYYIKLDLLLPVREGCFLEFGGGRLWKAFFDGLGGERLTEMRGGKRVQGIYISSKVTILIHSFIKTL
jgi:hypothetical protein